MYRTLQGTEVWLYTHSHTHTPAHTQSVAHLPAPTRIHRQRHNWEFWDLTRWDETIQNKLEGVYCNRPGFKEAGHKSPISSQSCTVDINYDMIKNVNCQLWSLITISADLSGWAAKSEGDSCGAWIHFQLWVFSSGVDYGSRHFWFYTRQ